MEGEGIVVGLEPAVIADAADRILRLTLGTIAAFPELERQIAAIGFGAPRHASGKEVAVAIIVARARIGKWRKRGTQLHARRRARQIGRGTCRDRWCQ